MPAPPVSSLPPAPVPTDSKAEFNAKAYPFVNSLSTMAAEMNAVSDWINANLNNIGPSVFTDIVIDAPVGQASLNLRQGGVQNGRVYAGGGGGTDILVEAGRFVNVLGKDGIIFGTGNPTIAQAAFISVAGNAGFGVTSPDTSARIQSSNGIKLGNTANSNTSVFDWYEEGTFTPTAIGVTTAGTGTYVLRQGSYQRRGNRVRVEIVISWSAHTGTGALRISGLPFTSIAVANRYSTPSHYVPASRSAGDVMGPYITSGTSWISFDILTSAGSVLPYAVPGTLGTTLIALEYEV